MSHPRPSLPGRTVRALAMALAPMVTLLATALTATPAQAVPSYARQTGMDCAGCHVGAFGPQLTPAGILFKLGGYTDTDNKPGHMPFSGMAVASWTQTSKDQDPPPDHLKANNNLTLDEASLFIAGRFSDHVGSFVQITYDGIGHSTALDQTDIRWATPTEFGGHEAIVGVTLNNNPGVQDPFNSMPVWSFPFAAPPAGFGTGDAGSLINGGLEGIVLGLSAYTLYDKTWYAELGSYRSMAPSLQDNLGLGRDYQKLAGNAYWRLGWTRDLKSRAWHLGAFGWTARLNPDTTAGATKDSHRDIGIDGSYQFLGTREHVFTVYGSIVNELARAGDGSGSSHLLEQRLSATYHYDQTWGGGANVFSTHGSDPAASSHGLMLQADWTPWGKEGASAPSPFGWANLRLALQYWRYGTLNGDSSTASDHNTVSLIAWSSF